MTVFAAHEVRDDISPAYKFGEIRYVNKFYIHGDELERQGGDNLIPPGYRANIERAVADFEPETDYVLIAGDHLQLLAFTALLAGYNHWFRVLRYDRQLNDYIPVRLHSGLVPPRGSVLVSGTDIGETDHEDRRQKGDPRFTRELAVESPLARRDPRKRDAT